MNEIDKHFFDRADAHISLANMQTATISRGKVSASMMYSVARFNAWVIASDFNNSEEMSSAKQETIKFLVTEYEKMLTENLEDYIIHFDHYMK